MNWFAGLFAQKPTPPRVPKRVFVVGLERHIERLTQINLERQSLDVYAAHDMEEASELARQGPPKFVIVSIDDEEAFQQFVLWHKSRFDEFAQRCLFEKTHFINIKEELDWDRYNDEPTAPAVVTPIFPKKRH